MPDFRPKSSQSQALKTYLARLIPHADDTINKLSVTEFREDPIAGWKYSRATSIISSAYKRHGQLLERALLERLKDCSQYEVWKEENYKLSIDSLTQLRIHDRVEKCLRIELPYGDRDRSIPVDIICFDKKKKMIRSYNVKRGNGNYDAGKKRIILGELLRTNMLLKDYGRKLGFAVEHAEAKIIFYYGVRSISEPLSLVREDLDEHFDFPVCEAVESVNNYFKEKLHELIESK